ncbi:MAG TPA: DUF502 domain-containing protein [Phycisphaerae bacterium]|nr:DUF502 domain-containing protein [Phycisphaerae bacterium]
MSPPPNPSDPSHHHNSVVDSLHTLSAAPSRVRASILSHLRSILLTGLLTVIPLFITLWVLSFLYGLVTIYTATPAAWITDRLLAPWLSAYISEDNIKTVLTPFLAVLISLVIVYVLGLLGTFFIGRQILARLERFIESLPLIKGVYGTAKQVMSVFRSGGGGAGFQRVALVEFPRLGTWTIAFVTNTIDDNATGKKLVCCFIPMTPNPMSGFFQLFPEDQVRATDWTVDMGLKIVLSGGLLVPSQINNPEAAPATP